MSAFICSDLHIATIAKNIGMFFEYTDEMTQGLANRLKAINVASVNFRYAEKTKKTRCNVKVWREDLNLNDVAKLIDCWHYQSCENPEDVDFLIMTGFLYWFINQSCADGSKSMIWSV